jgi:hypothetical protein
VKRRRRNRRARPDAATLSRNAENVRILRKRYKSFKRPKLTESEYVAANLVSLLGTGKRLKNPRGAYVLIARKGKQALIYTGKEFSARGKPVTFGSSDGAITVGKLLRLQFPILKHWQLSARPLLPAGFKRQAG